MKARCPVCGDPATPDFKPFCSRGCKDRDLLRWLDEGYRMPGPAAESEGEESVVDKNLDKGGDPD